MGLAPSRYSSWLLGAALDLSPRTAVQTAMSYTSYGLAVESQQDYPGWKYAAANVASFQRQAIEVAALLRRRYSAGQPRHPGPEPRPDGNHRVAAKASY